MKNKNVVRDICSTVKQYHEAGADKNVKFGINSSEWNIENFAILGNLPLTGNDIAEKTDYYNVVLCLKGSMQKTVGPFIFDVFPNSIHLASPSFITSCNHATADLELYQVLFRKDFLTHNFLKDNIVDNLLEVNPDYPPIYGLSSKSFESLKALYQKIEQESRSMSAFYLQILRLQVTDLLYEMNRACENCLLNSTRHLNKQYQLVFKFKKLVEENFLTMKTVQEFADALFISSKYLTEIVKGETGQNALQVIHSRIYLEAQYLLSSSALSIKEVAVQLNFDNSAHFSRFFKHFGGHNASEFKKLQAITP